MRHYFLILMVTWGAMFFILLSSWFLIFVGLNLGDYTIYIPVLMAIGGVAYLSKQDWFKESIREPLAATLNRENIVEICIHMQLFTIICGVVGLGLGVAAMMSIYPIGANLALRQMEEGTYQWQYLSQYAPMSVMAGFGFGIFFYGYLFADARDNDWFKKVLLLSGFLFFFVLGIMFSPDGDFLIAQ